MEYKRHIRVRNLACQNCFCKFVLYIVSNKNVSGFIFLSWREFPGFLLQQITTVLLREIVENGTYFLKTSRFLHNCGSRSQSGLHSARCFARSISCALCYTCTAVQGDLLKVNGEKYTVWIVAVNVVPNFAMLRSSVLAVWRGNPYQVRHRSTLVYLFYSLLEKSVLTWRFNYFRQGGRFELILLRVEVP